MASASFPNGFEKPAQWHVGLHDPPPAVATVRAATPSGTHTYLALHDRALAWATHALGSVEFYSWAPRPDDFERPAFGRILLEPAGNTPPQALHDAAHIVRRVLAKFDFDAIVMLDGRGSLALWLPVADPPFDVLSEWLHKVAAQVASDHPKLFVTQPHAHGDGLVRIAVAKNAPGTFTALPYSARGLPHLPVCLPAFRCHPEPAEGARAAPQRGASRGERRVRARCAPVWDEALSRAPRFVFSPLRKACHVVKVVRWGVSMACRHGT